MMQKFIFKSNKRQNLNWIKCNVRFITVCAAADKGVLWTGVRLLLLLSHRTICPEYVPPTTRLGWNFAKPADITSDWTRKVSAFKDYVLFLWCMFFLSLLGNERCTRGCFSCTSGSRPEPLHRARVERPRCCYRKPPAAQDTEGKDGSHLIIFRALLQPVRGLWHAVTNLRWPV